MDKRIRIVSDGTAWGTRVYVVTDNGEIDISSLIVSVSWTLGVGERTAAVALTLFPPNIDVAGILDNYEHSE